MQSHWPFEQLKYLLPSDRWITAPGYSEMERDAFSSLPICMFIGWVFFFFFGFLAPPSDPLWKGQWEMVGCLLYLPEPTLGFSQVRNEIIFKEGECEDLAFESYSAA